ncbi:hypothetical protein ACH4TC_34515 [Streptomyces spororaveus]|uniref:hypothetical protein n=1 Tax=Streptomyces spororaveus TaxID=284039 RepID=UPI0037BD68F9
MYAYAEVRWDGPGFYPVDDTTIFDGAKLRVQIKQSREGTDLVVVERDFPGLEARLEDSTSSGSRSGTAACHRVTLMRYIHSPVSSCSRS